MIRSLYAAQPPVIDGRIGEGEWATAARLTLRSRGGGDARCVFLLMNDEAALYVGVDAVDDRTNTSRAGRPRVFDNMAIWFNGQVGYWLYGDNVLRTDKIDPPNGATYGFTSTAKGAAQGPPAVPHMTYELLIPLGEIGVRAGDAVRAGLHYWDTYDTGPSFWWPANVDVFRPDRYGTLQTSRRP